MLFGPKIFQKSVYITSYCLQKILQTQGIPTAIYYPKPLHLQMAFKELEHRKGDFQVSESVSDRILSLPMHPYLSESDIDKITRLI